MRHFDAPLCSLLFCIIVSFTEYLKVGQVEGDKVVYNKAGEAAVETMQREMKRNANLIVHWFVIMPDHVHLRIYIRPNTKDPLVQIGRFVQNFKRWSKWRASQLGVEVEWRFQK